MKPSLPGLALLFRASIPLTLLLTGCGANFKQASVLPSPNAKRHGLVHGGEQPISGATIQLYAVGTTADASAATPLLSPAPTSAADGTFDITGTYTCPSPSSLIYMVATGGNPGLAPGTNNSAISLMAALGPCSTLSSSTFIIVNELTTVAGVYALAPFMASPSAIGSAPGDLPSLSAQFTLASQLANYSTGTAPGANLPPGTTVPVALINTLANVLSSCINSVGGTAGDNTPCGNLFTLTNPGTAPPSNTIAATLNVANNPSLNTQSLFNLAPPSAPFQPQLSSAPVDFSIGLTPPIALSISPESLTFPSTIVGFSSSDQITLTNTGQTPIVFAAMGINTSGDFVQTNNCPISLGASASCVVQVVFTPSAVGSRSSALSVSNAANSSQVIPLQGTGILGSTAGPITVSPSHLAFTQVNAPQTVTLTNQGSTPLAIGTISTTGAYSQTNNCGTTLSAQSICTISVSATAFVLSTNGTLTIYDDAASGPQSIPLQNASSVTLAQSSLSFGEWATGVTSITQSFAALRTGPTGVSFNVGGISGPNASDFQYVLSPSPICSDEFACTLSVTFTPSAVGTRTATISTNLGYLFLSGIGMPPGPSFTYPGPPAFQATLNINNGPYQTTLTNNGSTALNITANITGSNASDVAILNQCGSVPTSSSCLIIFNFKPSQVGTFSDLLTLIDTQSGLQRTYPVVSYGVPPGPSTSPSSLTFGNTQVGATSTPQSFTVNSSGNPVAATVLLNGGPSAFAITQGVRCSTTPCTVTVVMTPNSTSCCSANLQITDTVTQEVAYVTLLGTGGLPGVSFSPPSGLSFPVRAVGSTSIAQTVTLTNTGNANLVFGGFPLSGSDPSDFIQSSDCPHSLSPNSQCTFNVSFAPTAAGTRTAAIQIVSNAPTSPDLIQLTGTAQ
jgi:hypothetical protein